jgi:hypothetical protein
MFGEEEAKYHLNGHGITEEIYPVALPRVALAYTPGQELPAAATSPPLSTAWPFSIHTDDVKRTSLVPFFYRFDGGNMCMPTDF